MSISEQLINFAMQQISWNIDTFSNVDIPGTKDDWKTWEHEILGTPVVVFNPLQWEISIPVQLNTVSKKVTHEDGTDLPIQYVRGKQTNACDKYNTLFCAKVPAFGYKTYRMFLKKEQTLEAENPFSNSEYCLENSLVKMKFNNKSGMLESYFDKGNDRELLSGQVSAVLLDETECDTWAHGVKRFKDQIGKFNRATVKLIDNGCVRSVMRVISYYGLSTLRQDYILYADKAEVEVCAEMLKLKFPVRVENSKALCEIPYGFVERPTDGVEYPCGQWFCVTDSVGGLGIANDSKHSFDIEGSVVSLTVLRSAIYADHFGKRDEFCEFIDQGIHEFRYSIFPFRSVSDTVKKAYELNAEPRHVIESKFRVSFTHNEIKTFLIDDKGKISELDLIENRL